MDYNILLFFTLLISITFSSLPADPSGELCQFFSSIDAPEFVRFCDLRVDENYADFCNTNHTQTTHIACIEDMIVSITLTLQAPDEDIFILTFPLTYFSSLETLNLHGNRTIDFNDNVVISSLEVLSITNPILLGDFSKTFPSLTSLSISNYYNNPSFIANFLLKPNIGTLAFYGNFIGVIPTAIGKITSLISLTISETNLVGSIPPQISMLSELLILVISNNKYISGTIPWEIGCDCSKLQILTIAGNDRISGTIPPQLGLLSNLQILQLNSNKLNGTIPMELSFVPDRFDEDYLWCYTNKPDRNSTTNAFQNMVLSKNQLTGTIPPQMGNLRIDTLMLFDNQLTGTIPPIETLSNLQLYSNFLEGSIPPQLLNLQILRVGNNSNLNGTVPPQIFFKSPHLLTMELLGTNIAGTLPPEIGQASKLATLNLQNTLMNGTIPYEICNISLNSFYLSDHFTGCWFQCLIHFPVTPRICTAAQSIFGCTDDCKVPDPCIVRNECSNNPDDNLSGPPSNRVPSPASTPSSPSSSSEHSPSSLVSFIHRELYLKNRMTSLYSFFSNLYLSADQILRIQNWVDLHQSTLTIFGVITSNGGWNSTTSTIIVAPTGTINITYWNDVNSKIIVSGNLLVNTLLLYGSTLDVDSYASINDNLVANNARLEIKGNVYINSSTFHNTEFIFTPNSNLTFWSCVDLSDSILTLKISPIDLINQTDIIILTSNNSCLTPFKTTQGIATYKPCIAVDVEQHYNASAIWVTFTTDESPCDVQDNKFVIIIVSVIVSFFVIAVVLITAVFKVPALRKRFLPFRDFERYIPQRDDQYTRE